MACFCDLAVTKWLPMTTLQDESGGSVCSLRLQAYCLCIAVCAPGLLFHVLWVSTYLSQHNHIICKEQKSKDNRRGTLSTLASPWGPISWISPTLLITRDNLYGAQHPWKLFWLCGKNRFWKMFSNMSLILKVSALTYRLSVLTYRFEGKWLRKPTKGLSYSQKSLACGSQAMLCSEGAAV